MVPVIINSSEIRNMNDGIRTAMWGNSYFGTERIVVPMQGFFRLSLSTIIHFFCFFLHFVAGTLLYFNIKLLREGFTGVT